MTVPEQPEPFRRGAQRVGSLIKGKYKLEKLLGAGGMASVYAATHRNGIRVAVKILHPEMSHDPEMCQRFLREGYVANKVGHKGAVRVLDDDVCEDGAVFLVMELLEGDTLDERWERSGQRLPALQVLDIGHQLLDILSSAHAQQIVHRDIKPDNIFLTRPNDTVNVLDFGIARLREGLESSATATRTGRTMGTPAFMPHEQALGRAKDVDHQTDIWAVGATLFTLLTGRHVHEAESVNELLVFAATKRAPKVATLAPNTPRALAAVIDRALEFEKIKRWPDARSMQVALDESRASVGAEAAAAPSPSPRTLSPVVHPTPATSTMPQAAHEDPRSSAVSQEALAATVSSSSMEVVRAAEASGDFARGATMISGDVPIAALPSTSTHVGVASSKRPEASIPFQSLGLAPKIMMAAVGALLFAVVVYAAFLRPGPKPLPPVAATAKIDVDPPLSSAAVIPAPSAVASAAPPTPTPPTLPTASIAATPIPATPVRPHPSSGPAHKPPPITKPTADPYGSQ